MRKALPCTSLQSRVRLDTIAIKAHSHEKSLYWALNLLWLSSEINLLVFIVRVIPDTTTKPPTTTTSTHRTSARVPYRDQKPIESESDVMTYIYEYITYDDADDKVTEEKTKARENLRANNPLSFYFWYKMFMNLRQ